MTATALKKQHETMDDIKHGQIVIVVARWVLIVAALFFLFWNPGGVGQLRAQILFLFMLAFANFYLHAEILRKKPINRGVIFLASIGDLLVITIIVIGQGGFPSHAFVFYLPAIMAFAVSFPGAATFLITSGLLFFYMVVAVYSLLIQEPAATSTDFQVLVARLIVLAGVAFCGNMYRRIELGRRRELSEAEALLKKHIVDESA